MAEEPLAGSSLGTPVHASMVELLNKLLDFIVGFNQTDPRNLLPNVLAETNRTFQSLLEKWNNIRQQLPEEEFRAIITRQANVVLELLLGIYRNHVPGTRSLLFPDEFVRLFTDMWKGPLVQITNAVYYDREFAAICLRRAITAESAFPMVAMLIVTMKNLPSYIETMEHWLIEGEGENLLLLEQIFSSVQYLLPEICVPGIIQKQDFYTNTLIRVCSILPMLGDKIIPCRKTLVRHLKSDNAVASLLASDTLKFLSGFTMLDYTAATLVEIFPLLVQEFYSDRANRFVIHNLCQRLFVELPAGVKMLELFPIRRHFSVWSQMLLGGFSELYSQPDIFQELYNECIRNIEGIFSQSTTFSTIEILVRLPLALHCLSSLITWMDNKKCTEAPDCSVNGFTKWLMRLFRFLTDDQLSPLPIIKQSLCYLLKLGAKLQHLLLEPDINEIFEHLSKKETDAAVLNAGTDVSKSLIMKRVGTLGSMSEKIIVHVAQMCCHANPAVKVYALSSVCWMDTHHPCPNVCMPIFRIPNARTNLEGYLSTKPLDIVALLVRMYSSFQQLSETAQIQPVPQGNDIIEGTMYLRSDPVLAYRDFVTVDMYSKR